MTWMNPSEYVDDTPFGRGGDHCPWCGADWKRPHYSECPEAHTCEYPPGCGAIALPGRRLCPTHFDAISRMFGPLEEER